MPHSQKDKQTNNAQITTYISDPGIPTPWSSPQLEAAFCFCEYAFLETDLRNADDAMYDLIDVDAEHRALKTALRNLLNLSRSGRQPGLSVAQEIAEKLLERLAGGEGEAVS